MKRIIMIIAIPLLVVLCAWFGAKSQTRKVQETFPNLVPEVSSFGTLINLKDEKGTRLSSKPIQEGFYVRFRVGNGKEQVIDAIGDKISDPKACLFPVYGTIPGAGITTLNGLNVTSGFIFDKNNGTLKVIRTIVNLSKEDATIYLSEVKNHADTKLLSKEKATMYLSEVKNHADTIPAGIVTKYGLAEPLNMTGACWPCLPWPDCLREGSTNGKHMTSQELSEAAVKRSLTLPVRSAIFLTTEYKVILPR
jgi:hypothetical protein